MLEFPSNLGSSQIADWIELELLVTGGFLSKSKLTSLIGNSTGSEPDEFLLSDIWNNLRKRELRFSKCSYMIEGDLAIANEERASSDKINQTCLYLSLYGAPPKSQPGPKIFERICGEALQKYLNGELFIFGWPPLENTEVKIAERVQQVAELTGERFVEAPGARYKDRGLDIVAWKPFEECRSREPRSGQIVVLSQCAAGHDWRNKTRELPMASWKEYIHWSSEPLPAFSVPCIIDDDLWHDICKEVEGLVFDRIRIVNSLSTGIQDTDLDEVIDNWLEAQMEEYTT